MQASRHGGWSCVQLFLEHLLEDVHVRLVDAKMTADNLQNTWMSCELAWIWGSAPTLFTATDTSIPSTPDFSQHCHEGL